MTPRNVLDIKKAHALTNWLTENAPKLRDLTMQQVADNAAQALGFRVTKANVANVRDVFDLDLGRHQAAQHDGEHVLQDIERRLDSLEAWVGILVNQLRDHLDAHGKNDTKAPAGTAQLPL